MARIIGLACDNCGQLDVEVNYSIGVNEDSFPRNGWISLTQWADEGDPGGPEEDLHICSTECLKDFVLKIEEESHEGHDHPHE